jgi:hypothetical protein
MRIAIFHKRDVIAEEYIPEQPENDTKYTSPILFHER